VHSSAFRPFPTRRSSDLVELTAGAFFAAEGNDIVVVEAEKFRNVIPHNHASEWRGQSGDKQAVITPRDRAGDRAGCVTSQTIGRSEEHTSELQSPDHLVC